MVYEYGYEYGFEKREDQRTESQTEGKIQYFILSTLFNGCSTSYVLRFVYVKHIGSKQSQGRKGGERSMSMLMAQKPSV